VRSPFTLWTLTGGGGGYFNRFLALEEGERAQKRIDSALHQLIEKKESPGTMHPAISGPSGEGGRKNGRSPWLRADREEREEKRQVPALPQAEGGGGGTEALRRSENVTPSRHCSILLCEEAEKNVLLWNEGEKTRAVVRPRRKEERPPGGDYCGRGQGEQIIASG